jgi:hypothetical protein
MLYIRKRTWAVNLLFVLGLTSGTLAILNVAFALLIFPTLILGIIGGTLFGDDLANSQQNKEEGK